MSERLVDEERARKVLAALSDGDTAAFGELVADGIEIHTARGVRSGHSAAVAWAANKYEHLQRRYSVERIEQLENGGVLVHGDTEYVWKDGGELADSSPVVVELHFAGGKLALWRFREQGA
ncbi:MAG: nuclear transport factor 2 family protein [Solirubrobacterales bacterium]